MPSPGAGGTWCRRNSTLGRGGRFLIQASGDVRTARLHLMTAGSERWSQQLAFRDALRADPGLRRRYAALKQQLAVEHAEDREAYTSAKMDFITAAVRRGQT